MEIISIDAALFDKILSGIEALSMELERLCEDKDLASCKWLNNDQACELLHCTRRTLQNYRDSGRLPYSQIERKVYYRPQDLQELLKSTSQIHARYE